MRNVDLTVLCDRGHDKKARFLPQESIAVLVIVLSAFTIRAGTYSNDFNSNPTLDPNFKLRGDVAWQSSGSYDNSGFISLTYATSDQLGTIIVPDLDAGAPVAGFNLRMKVRIDGGFPPNPPADGLSVSFADAADPIVNTGLVTEEGTATGISINIDTLSEASTPFASAFPQPTGFG